MSNNQTIKNLRVKNSETSISQVLPIGADAVNVELANRRNLQETIGNIDSRTDGSITNNLEVLSSAIQTLDNIKADVTMIGSPLVAGTASEMTDTSRIYVYTGSESGYTNGNWYYYDGTIWASGGVYNSTAVETDKTLKVENVAADSRATGNMVLVSQTQPTAASNKIWIDPDANEIEIPTIDDVPSIEEFNKLKDDLTNTEHEINGVLTVPVEGTDIIQGTYSTTSAVVANANRIRISGMMKVYKGQTIKFTAGTIIKQFIYGIFTDSGSLISEGSWKGDGTSVSFEDDSNVVIVFRKGASDAITPSDYDATVNIVSSTGSRLDLLESQIATDVTRIENKTDTALANTDDLYNKIGYDETLIDAIAIEVGMELPTMYDTITGEKNVSVTLVDHLALDSRTEYTFTFGIKEAINTIVYFYIYKDQETHLVTGGIPIGDTSSTLTYTTSSSVPFTDGKIVVSVNKADLYCDVTIAKTNDVPSRIDRIINSPLSTLPAYVRGNLAYKPLGALEHPYLCLVSDDGNISLNTYTIPMLLQKEVPCTFALMQSSAVMADQTNIDIVKNAIANGGCAVAQHGGSYWTNFSEKGLNDFFDSEAEFFATNEIDVKGAVLPGHMCSDMVASLAGGRFGVLRSGYNGAGSSRIVKYGSLYANGARSNLYQLTSFNVADYSLQYIKDAIDEAVTNNYLICIYWHDDSLSNAGKANLENVIDYAKTTGIEFITLGDVLSIT